jgi:hypothetical protein
MVGIITETNQFVGIVETPYDETEHNILPIIEQSNTNTIDKIVNTSNTKEDKERVKVVNTIVYEGQFYSAFRTTIRGLLNDYKNRKIRKFILKIIDDSHYSYKNKIILIQEKLKEISKEEIDFFEYGEDIDILGEISTCLNSSQCGGKKFCLMTKENICRINIPKINLINSEDNEENYYLRLADELLRYKRIQLYMFENNINMIDIDYKINEDELIIIKNLLLGNEEKNAVTYFDNLVPFQQNKYTHVITYDTAEPYLKNKIVDKEFSEIKRTNKRPVIDNDSSCVVKEEEVTGNIQTSRWKQYFQTGKELVFNNDKNECTFEVLKTILRMENRSLDIVKIKEILIKEYKKLAEHHLPALLKIWINDSKITKPQSKNMSIDQIEKTIQGDYFITDIDIWILAESLNLPIFLFCTTGLKLLKIIDHKYKLAWLLFSDYDEKKKYYFIRSPSEDSLKKTSQPKYQMIVPTFLANSEFLGIKNAYPEQTGGLTEFLKKIVGPA